MSGLDVLRTARRWCWALGCVAATVACKRASPPPAQAVAEICEAQDVVADETHAYLACGSSVQRVPLVGGTAETVAADAERPRKLALLGDAVYWTTSSPAGVEQLKRAPKRGGEPEVFKRLGENGSLDRQQVLVADEQSLYTRIAGKPGSKGHELVRIEVSDGTAHTLARDTFPRVVHVDAGHVYWATGPNGPGTVRRVAKAGGEVVTLATTERLSAMALTADYVYFCSTPLVAKGGGIDGGLMRVPKAGGTPQRASEWCSEELTLADDSYCWTVNGSYVGLSSSRSGALHCAPLPVGSTKRAETLLFEGLQARGPFVRGRNVYWVGVPKDEGSSGARLYRQRLFPMVH